MEKQEEKKASKLTYEQLENVAHQMSEQSKQLYNQLQEARMNNAMKRLDYMFKVLEFKECFHSDFIIKVSEELEEIMYSKTPEPKTESDVETK